MSSTLRSARLRRILTAYTINRLGNWFGFVALSVAVYDQTHSAIAVSALLVAGQVLPAFAVPVLVARVEASRRRSELSGLYLFEAVATTALAILLWHFWLPAILLIAALDGTAGLAASALLRSEAARAARDEVDEEEIEGAEALTERVHTAEREANAALNVAFSSAFVLGPAIAGVVVAAAGSPTALLIDAALFVLCAGLLLDLRPDVEDAGGDSVRARLREALAHIREVPAMRTLLAAQAVALVFFSAGSPIEVIYAKVTLGGGDRGLGFLLAAWGLGAVAGSIVFARSTQRPVGVMLTAGTLAVGLAYVGFAVSPALAPACAAALLGGLGNGVQWASLISAVQLMTPPGLQGRMMGAVESLGALCPAIGLTLGGVLVALTGTRTAFLLAGIGACATTLAFLRLASAGISSGHGDPPAADPADSPQARTVRSTRADGGEAAA